MNIMKEVTIRQMKQNRKRTVVTMIGVIISVAMITAVTTLAVSFMNMMQRQVMEYTGDWHVAYPGINAEQIEELKADPKHEAVSFYSIEGYAPFETSQNKNRPYLYLKSYSSEMFEHFHVELLSGRYPEKPGEVVITEAINQNAGSRYEIGDTIEAAFGKRMGLSQDGDPIELTESMPLARDEGEIAEQLENTKLQSLVVVGIMSTASNESTISPSYSLLSYLDLSTITEGGKSATAMVLVDKPNNKLYDDANAYAQSFGLESAVYNNDLLRLHGLTRNESLRATLYGLAAIILVIIVLASVMLIYNAFAISVSERTRHLGMLSSIGATRKQKRNSVFFEGFVIGVVAIPIGLISGVGGIALTIYLLGDTLLSAVNSSMPMVVRVNPSSILLSIALAALTIFVSTLRPARRASRISAIDAIRQTSDIKLEASDIKTSSLIRRVLGLEAELGLKNLKRNRKRFLSTVLSISLSIVLFLTVSYFTQILKKSMELGDSAPTYDLLIRDARGEEQSQLLFDSLAARPEVESIIQTQEYTLFADLPISKLSTILQEQIAESPDMAENGLYQNYLTVFTLDPASFETYAKKTGTDIDQLEDPNHLTAIMIRNALHEDPYLGSITELAASQLEAGDSLALYDLDYETDERIPIQDLEILTITDELPMGVNQPSIGGLTIIVSDTVYKQLGQGAQDNRWRFLMLRSTDAMETERSIESLEDYDFSIYNVLASRQNSFQLLFLMQVFIYGFIALMTLISIANIFNTISTGIALRRREFAMLKSVGMTPRSFKRMIRFESFFYGLNALSLGLPLSFIFMLLIHRSVGQSLRFSFNPPWMSTLIAVVAVFVIVAASMLYSGSKLDDANIVEALKDENS